MIFSALLESGTGCLHAVNERIAAVLGSRSEAGLSTGTRFTIASIILIAAVFFASRFGLVTLIARGYRVLTYSMVAVYIVPLLTVGLWKLRRIHAPAGTPAPTA